MVDDLFTDNFVHDENWQQAQTYLTTAQIMDTIVISGFYLLVSSMLNVARTPLESGPDSLPAHF